MFVSNYRTNVDDVNLDNWISENKIFYRMSNNYNKVYSQRFNIKDTLVFKLKFFNHVKP